MKDNKEILSDNIEIEVPIMENLIEIPVVETLIEIPIEEDLNEIEIDYNKIRTDTSKLKLLLKNAA